MLLRQPPPGARTLCAVALVLAAATSARADVRDFVGRPLADVRVELGGMPFVEPSVLQLIETRIGEPLSMERVRETVDHLVGLGRFEDIRVVAENSAARADGIALRWMLLPVRRISQIEVSGRPEFDVTALRGVISDRFGASPASSRVEQIVDLLTAYYVDRGYRRPVIEPRLSPGRAAEIVTLTLAIDPGARTLIGAVTVNGDLDRPAGAAIAELRLERGRPYDHQAIATRVAAFEQTLRDLGYYEARIEVVPVFSEDGSTANLTIDVDRGPRVRVVFAGDPLPESRRDALVPIRQERSVDLDLLEDASRNIEAYLREQGYRAAEAPYVREAKAGEMILTFTVSRGALHRLASIEVRNAQTVPQAELAAVVPLQPGEPFVDSRVAAVVAAVTELYRVRGFARVTVKPEVAVLAPQAAEGRTYRPVTVTLVVAEGPQTTVRGITVEGAVEVAEGRIRSLLVLTVGRPFYRPQLDADRDAIERLYHNEGFQNVRVEAQTSLANEDRRLDVHWIVREGPRTTVDHVLISGNVRTSIDLIRREIPLKPGEPLGDEGLIESQRRLAALGLFRRVRIVELPHGSSTSRDLLVEVEEGPATTVTYGGGLEAGRRPRSEGGQAVDRVDIAPRAFFEISRRNLWGKNRSVSLFTRVSLRARDPAVDSTDPTDLGGYGFNEYRVVGTFREPRPLDSAGDLQLIGSIEQAIRASFNFARRGVRAEYSRRLGNTVTVIGRYAIDRTRLFDEKIEPDDRLLIDRLFPNVRLSTLTGSVLRDSRDDVLDPQRGAVLGIDGSLALRALGSEVGFAKSFAQAFVYRRLPARTHLTFAAGMRMGFAAGFARLVGRVDANQQPVLGPDGQQVFDVVDDVPASERFFAGGDNTVRGFVLDRLGTDETLNAQGFPAGGEGLTVVNLELRTAYWKGLSGVGFLDAGNVFKRAGDIDLTELRPAAGFGLRYRSPLGPLRVDLGFNLDRRTLANGDKERGMVFHISLGQAF